jgi:hypothetical protein
MILCARRICRSGSCGRFKLASSRDIAPGAGAWRSGSKASEQPIGRLPRAWLGEHSPRADATPPQPLYEQGQRARRYDRAEVDR